MGAEGKKIAVLHVILSLEIGGMEQVVADLVRNTDRERFSVTVACLNALGPIAEELRAGGIEVIKVPPMRSKLSFFYPAPLIDVIRSTGADVIHVHSGCWYKTAIAALWCGKRNIVYTEHGRIFPDPKLVVLADRFFSRLTGRVVAVSQDLGDYLRDVVRVPRGKIAVIVNGIDTSKFPKNPQADSGGPVRIGVIARLAPVKDLGTLLRAMKIVLREEPEATLQVVGDGPERERLELLAKELGISGSVSFPGFRRDVPVALDGIDIYALSSLSEGTSMTILEAMAAGKPVVATRVGGTPAIVEDGVNGFLVPAGAPGELAGALLKLAADGALRDRMGETNRAVVEKKYSVQAMTRCYQRLYEEMLGGT